VLIAIFAARALPATPEAPVTEIELILDASGSMWNKLEDGRFRIDAAKQVLTEFISETPARPDLRIGLRIYGAKVHYSKPGACEDSELVAPIAPLDRPRLLAAVRNGRAIGATPLARSLDTPLDRAGRVLVAPDLSVPGHPNIFVPGDLAAINQDNGQVVPSVAPAAMQMGKLVAKNIRKLLDDLPTVKFKYFDKGNLATIGRNRAICEIGKVKLRGQFAWWFWLFVHLMYLATFRNRVIVFIEWAYSYLTYQRGSRLLTEREGDGVSGAGESAMGSIG